MSIKYSIKYVMFYIYVEPRPMGCFCEKSVDREQQARCSLLDRETENERNEFQLSILELGELQIGFN